MRSVREHQIARRGLTAARRGGGGWGGGVGRSLTGSLLPAHKATEHASADLPRRRAPEQSEVVLAAPRAHGSEEPVHELDVPARGPPAPLAARHLLPRSSMLAHCFLSSLGRKPEPEQVGHGMRTGVIPGLCGLTTSRWRSPSHVVHARSRCPPGQWTLWSLTAVPSVQGAQDGRGSSREHASPLVCGTSCAPETSCPSRRPTHSPVL